MSTYRNSLIAARFAAVAPEPLPGDWADVLRRSGVPQQRHAATGPERTRAHSRGRWVIVAVAGVVLVGGLLVTPALGLGDRLLGLIRSTPTPLDVQTPAWSPDGRKLAFVSRRDGNSEIYVINADGSGQENLTQHPARDSHPSWSRDGRKLAFVSRRDGNSEIYVMNADGSGLRNVTRAPSNDLRPAWSPDGGAIAFVKMIQGKCAPSATRHSVQQQLRAVPLCRERRRERAAATDNTAGASGSIQAGRRTGRRSGTGVISCRPTAAGRQSCLGTSRSTERGRPTGSGSPSR